MLDEAGYTNIVGIKGGFNKYFRFVPNVARGNPGRERARNFVDVRLTFDVIHPTPPPPPPTTTTTTTDTHAEFGFEPHSTFDAKNRRRVVDIMESVYSADGDAAGIHDSGAHFDRMDAPPIVIRTDPISWVEYADA